MAVRLVATVATAALATASVSAFAPPPSLSIIKPRIGRYSYSSSSSSSSDEGSNYAPTEGMDEDSRSALFQSLLRDLQIEGVPLLGCDAEQVSTLNAAIWTTMAERGEPDDERRACLVMKNIPTSALLAFAEDFTVLKTQDRLMGFLPELRRYSVSVLGKGLGPALLIETEKRLVVEQLWHENQKAIEDTFDKDRTIAALRSFVGRVVVGAGLRPRRPAGAHPARGALEHRPTCERSTRGGRHRHRRRRPGVARQVRGRGRARGTLPLPLPRRRGVRSGAFPPGLR